jgi:hypothetical protein
MTVKKLLALSFLALFNSSAGAADCTADPLILQPNQWRQIALPCQPPVRTADTVKAIFGDDILSDTPEEYGTTWVIYAYKKIDGKYDYEKLDLESGFLEQGHGYWIIQTTAAAVEIDMPASSTATPTRELESPPHTKWFETELGTLAGGVGWNMLGNPYNHVYPIKQGIRVKTNDKGPTTCLGFPQVGCSLEDASKEGIFHDKLFRYNAQSKTYDILGVNDQFEVWDGFWAATLKRADTTEPKLRLVKQ